MYASGTSESANSERTTSTPERRCCFFGVKEAQGELPSSSPAASPNMEVLGFVGLDCCWVLPFRKPEDSVWLSSSSKREDLVALPPAREGGPA